MFKRIFSVTALAASLSGGVHAQDLTVVDTPFRSAKPVLEAGVATPATVAAVASAAEPKAGRWEVRVNDVTILKTFERWAVQAGYRLKWDAEKNFLVGAPDVIEGSFESAVLAILGSPGISQSDYPLGACIYANTPPLIRVTRRGAEGKDCDQAQ